jgi:hypothetical protein
VSQKAERLLGSRRERPGSRQDGGPALPLHQALACASLRRHLTGKTVEMNFDE